MRPGFNLMLLSFIPPHHPPTHKKTAGAVNIIIKRLTRAVYEIHFDIPLEAFPSLDSSAAYERERIVAPNCGDTGEIGPNLRGFEVGIRDGRTVKLRGALSPLFIYGGYSHSLSSICNIATMSISLYLRICLFCTS